MIDTEKHKIGDLVCLCRTKKILGTIVSYNGRMYKVMWDEKAYTDSKTTNHSKYSITVMKKFLHELYNN